MRKEYQDRIKEYCKENNITVKDFCERVGLNQLMFTPPNADKWFCSLLNLIKIESYCKDIDLFKLDISLRIKKFIYDFQYQYLDKDLISIDDYYKIYKILKPYIIKQYNLKNNKEVKWK